LTGQNNSFVPDFEPLAVNNRRAGVRAKVRQIDVEVVALDTFVVSHALTPAFIKIDVEGFELAVLRGAEALLREHKPALMVEVQADHHAIAALAENLEYVVVDELGALWSPEAPNGNTFWLQRQTHSALITDLNLTTFRTGAHTSTSVHYLNSSKRAVGE
jgi:hypothetical protein